MNWSAIVLLDLRLKKNTRAFVEFTHPLDPVQSDYVHQAFHHIQTKHHSYRSDKEDEAS